MANELKDNALCGNCRHYKYTGNPYGGFCMKRKIVTKEKAVCGSFSEPKT